MMNLLADSHDRSGAAAALNTSSGGRAALCSWGTLLAALGVDTPLVAGLESRLFSLGIATLGAIALAAGAGAAFTGAGLKA
jgi:hypothetical protein